MSNAFLREDALADRSDGSSGTVMDRTGQLGDYERMTIGGVVSASGVLFSILLVAGLVGWRAVTVEADVVTQMPGWIMAAVAVGIVTAIATFFKPQWARVLGPIYAIAYGLVVGAVSRVYEVQFDGIVLQAVLLTLGVFATMLFIYANRIIRVTSKLRKGIMAATMGIMFAYLLTFIVNLIGFDFELPFIHDSGPLGIGISLVIVGVAAFNYLLDFDVIERSIAAGAPKSSEWMGAFGLLMTTVWLYLELLRLLAKLRD